jgi:hypothetical protein
MADGRASIVSKATALKNAGFHPVTTLLIIVLSSPGIIEKFFDDDAEVAREAIEKAYPVLSKEVEHLRDDNQRLYEEMNNIRRTMMFMYMGGGMYPGGFGAGMPMMPPDGDFYGELTPPSSLFPAAADGDGDADGEGAAEGADEPPGPPEPVPEPIPTKDDLDYLLNGPPKSPLDGLIQQQQAPMRDKLPDLGELLGK